MFRWAGGARVQRTTSAPPSGRMPKMRRPAPSAPATAPACCGSPTGASRGEGGDENFGAAPHPHGRAHQGVHHIRSLGDKLGLVGEGTPRGTPRRSPRRGRHPAARLDDLSCAPPGEAGLLLGQLHADDIARHGPFHEHGLAVRQMPHGRRPEAHALDGHHLAGRARSARGRSGSRRDLRGRRVLSLRRVDGVGRTRRYRSWWTYRSLGGSVPFSFHLRGILRICRPVRRNCPL